jgi:hypothetical protein
VQVGGSPFDCAGPGSTDRMHMACKRPGVRVPLAPPERPGQSRFRDSSRWLSRSLDRRLTVTADMISWHSASQAGSGWRWLRVSVVFVEQACLAAGGSWAGGWGDGGRLGSYCDGRDGPRGAARPVRQGTAVARGDVLGRSQLELAGSRLDTDTGWRPEHLLSAGSSRVSCVARTGSSGTASRVPARPGPCGRARGRARRGPRAPRS